MKVIGLVRRGEELRHLIRIWGSVYVDELTGDVYAPFEVDEIDPLGLVRR